MTPNIMNGEISKGPSATMTAPDSAPSDNVSDVLRTLRMRSAQDSLGVHAKSGLMMAFLQAGAVTILLLLALTAGPYFYDRAFPPAPKAAKQNPADAAQDNTPAATAPPQSGSNVAAKKTPDGPGPKTPGKKDFVDILGESGTKKGTPTNPLDRKDDDLLKDLK